LSVSLAVWFIEQHTLVDDKHPPFFKGDPMDATELLWPMLEIFQGGVADKLAKVPYTEAAEAEVDEMLEGMAQNPMAENVTRTNEGSRVLLERVKQSIVTMTANAASNKTVFIPTLVLPLGYRQIAIALLWLHEMKLPFEPGTVLPFHRTKH
jgi:hypothetical protein